MIFLEYVGSRASLSDELTGQKWSVNGQNRKPDFQDFNTQKNIAIVLK